VRVVECRAARCGSPSLPGALLCVAHVDVPEGFPMKRGRPRILSDDAVEVESGDSQVQETGVSKVGRRRPESERRDDSVLLQDVPSDIRVFPEPPESPRAEAGAEEAARVVRKSKKKKDDLHLGADADLPSKSPIEPMTKKRARTVAALIAEDPDPQMYGGKFLIPLIASVDWETLPLDVVKGLLVAVNEASEKASPIYRKRLESEAVGGKCFCIYCESPIADGKWWNRTVIRDEANIDVPIHFDSNRCYLMYFKGDQSRTRAVMASS